MPPPVPVLLNMPAKVSLALEMVSATLPNNTLPPDPDPAKLTTDVPPELIILKVPLTFTLLEFEILPPLPSTRVAPELMVEVPPKVLVPVSVSVPPVMAILPVCVSVPAVLMLLITPGKEPAAAVKVNVCAPNNTEPAPLLPESVLIDAPAPVVCEMSKVPLTTTPLELANMPPLARISV